MWDWLKSTVCGNYNTDLEEHERVFIVLLYEHLETVLQAATDSHSLQKTKIRASH
jgi:hypothetical protein